MDQEELEQLRKNQKIIEGVVRSQLFYETYIATNPPTQEQFEKRVRYFSARLGQALWRANKT